MKIFLWFIFLLGAFADGIVSGIIKAENQLAEMERRHELERRMR
jgi:hypothetical protein